MSRDLADFDKAAAQLRLSVSEMGGMLEHDHFTGVLDSETGVVLIWACGESANVLRRVLKLKPNQTPKNIRDEI